MTNRLWLIVVIAAGLCGQDATAPGAAAFEEGLTKATQMRARGQWKAARESVVKLIEQHGKQDYIQWKASEIDDLVRECAFSEAHPPLQPKDVISGELVSWTPSTGQIKLKYKPDTMKDWERGEGYRVHPILFRDAHTVEIKSASVNSSSAQSGLFALVCTTADLAIRIVPGLAAEKMQEGATYMPASIDLIRQSGNSKLATKDTSPVKPGKPLHIKVKVTAGQVQVTQAGALFLDAKKDKDHWGRVAISNFTCDEIILEGKAESAWIQQRIDAETTKLRDKFFKSYRRTQFVPAWVFEAVAKAKVTALDGEDFIPAAITSPDEGKLVDEVLTMMGENHPRQALAKVQAWTEKQVQPKMKTCMLGIVLSACERPTEALAELRKARQWFPNWALGAQLEGAAARQLEQYDEAVKALSSIQDMTAVAPFVIAEAAVELMLVDRLDLAKALVEKAMRDKRADRMVFNVNKMLTKAASGPSFGKSFETKSQNFHVVSDIDQQTCSDAARLLEEAYLSYTVHLTKAKDAGQRLFKVFLFRGEAGYQAYCKDLDGSSPMHTAGLYMPALKQLLIWNLPSREDMLRTVRHEGFHQYIDRVAGEVPTWFNEGMAEYYETAELVRGEWKMGVKRPDHMEHLATGRLEPLASFLTMPHREFYIEAQRNYAQGWAMVHFLRHGPSDHRPRFKALWEGLIANRPWNEVVSEVFPAQDLPAIEKAFRAHLDTLR